MGKPLIKNAKIQCKAGRVARILQLARDAENVFAV